MSDIILDLSAYRDETADICLADGNVLHLKKPGEGLVIALLQLKDVNPEAAETELLTALNKVTALILNNNADGVRFDDDTVRAMALDVKSAIVSAYTDFATRLQSNPTTSSPQSPGSAPTETEKSRPWFGRFRSTRAARS